MGRLIRSVAAEYEQITKEYYEEKERKKRERVMRCSRLGCGHVRFYHHVKAVVKKRPVEMVVHPVGCMACGCKKFKTWEVE